MFVRILVLPLPPTGRSFQQALMHFVRFREGLAIEHRAVRDDLGMMRQLGVLPMPAQTDSLE